MVETGVREPEERGLSSRHLILIFLGGGAVCGIFFSLGFLVGFNERFSRSTPVSEVVTAPGAIPPTVNPPVEDVSVNPQGPSAPLNRSPDAGVTALGAVEPKPAEPAAKKTAAANPPADVKAAPEGNPQPPPHPAASEVGQGVTLQIAALRSKQDAEALVAVLKGRGYPVFLVAPEYAKADDNYFRVQVGPFRTHEDAEKVRAKLAQEGFRPFIRH